MPPLNKNFRCGDCVHIYETVGLLKAHCSQAHGKFSGNCLSCHAVFDSADMYVEHNAIRNRCPTCCQGFNLKSDLLRHYWIHMPESQLPFQCEYCGYKCVQFAEMERHMRSCGPLQSLLNPALFIIQPNIGQPDQDPLA